MDQPLVSVYMTTYFHEKYVGQAINSILAQRTTFPIEIVISDDCSGDGTADILREYSNKYDFITVNINPHNIGLTNNIFHAMLMCKGKYITGLSGDDYWIDENKLQKQVDFLQSHPEYIGVVPVMEARADNEDKGYSWYPDKKYVGKAFCLEYFLKGVNLPLNGLMRENFSLNPSDREYFGLMPKVSPYIDDVTTSVLLLKRGDVYVLPDISVVYRVRRNTVGDHNYNSLNAGFRNFERHINMLNELDNALKHDVDFMYRYIMIISDGLILSLKNRDFCTFINCYRSVPSLYKRRLLLLRSITLCMVQIGKIALYKVRGFLERRKRQ